MELSLLDLAPLPPGGTATDAFERTVARARHAEAQGYERLWVAEHHDFPNRIASVAPEVLIPHVAAKTSDIRVGSGTVLLNHYSPYKVAETFSVLDALAPGRIDLGVGRATGTPVRDHALQVDRDRRNLGGDHREKIAEVAKHLYGGFDDDHPFSGLDLPRSGETTPKLWVHGSSASSAEIAGALGLRYCFASFIRPQWAADALETYREHFQPSPYGAGPAEPQALVAANVTCAPTDEAAARLRAVPEATHRRLRRGEIDGGQFQSVDEAIGELGGVPEPTTAPEEPSNWPRAISGSPGTVSELLEAMTDDLGVEGVVIQNQFIEFDDELRSHALIAEAVAG